MSAVSEKQQSDNSYQDYYCLSGALGGIFALLDT